jgi:hypothetical protein
MIGKKRSIDMFHHMNKIALAGLFLITISLMQAMNYDHLFSDNEIELIAASPNKYVYLPENVREVLQALGSNFNDQQHIASVDQAIVEISHAINFLLTKRNAMHYADYKEISGILIEYQKAISLGDAFLRCDFDINRDSGCRVFCNLFVHCVVTAGKLISVGNASVGGDLVVNGNEFINGSLTVGGDITLAGSILGISMGSLSAWGYIFDNQGAGGTQVVANGADVLFNSTDANGQQLFNILHSGVVNADEITLINPGTYLVTWTAQVLASAATGTASAFQLTLNNALIPGTVFGQVFELDLFTSINSNLVGQAIVVTTAANSILTLRNVVGAPVTLRSSNGNTNNASINIVKIG